MELISLALLDYKLENVHHYLLWELRVLYVERNLFSSFWGRKCAGAVWGKGGHYVSILGNAIKMLVASWYVALIRILRPNEVVVRKTAGSKHRGNWQQTCQLLPVFGLYYSVNLLYLNWNSWEREHDCGVCYLQCFFTNFNLVSKMLIIEDPAWILDCLCIHWLCSDGKDYKAISGYSSFGKSCKI